MTARTMRSQKLLAGLAVVGVVALAGCGSAGTEDAKDTEASSVTYPDEGLDLGTLPAVKGIYNKALGVYVDFERGRRLVAREGKANPMFEQSTAGGVRKQFLAAAGQLGAQKYDGTVAVDVTAVKPHDLVMFVDLCVDGSNLDVPSGAPELLGTTGKVAQRVKVTNLEGPWRVTSVQDTGSC